MLRIREVYLTVFKRQVQLYLTDKKCQLYEITLNFLHVKNKKVICLTAFMRQVNLYLPVYKRQKFIYS